MQRTPIKLNVYSTSETGKEAIGYLVLDLRSATAQKQPQGKCLPILRKSF